MNFFDKITLKIISSQRLNAACTLLVILSLLNSTASIIFNLIVPNSFVNYGFGFRLYFYFGSANGWLILFGLVPIFYNLAIYIQIYRILSSKLKSP
jgi:hypothetical protein